MNRSCRSKRVHLSQTARCIRSFQRSKADRGRSCPCETTRVASLHDSRCPRMLLIDLMLVRTRRDAEFPELTAPLAREPVLLQALS
jgi:hypothetical protein